MKKKCNSRIMGGLIFSVLGLISLSASEGAALGSFSHLGADTDSLVSGLSSGGGSVIYHADTDGRSDIGIQAALLSAQTFSVPGDTLIYRATYKSITSSYDQNNTFRAGFDFGSDADLHFVTGYGTSTDARFAVNSSGNPFSYGTTVGTTDHNWLATDGLKFDTGSEIKVTFSLMLTRAGGGTFDYQFTVEYVDVLAPGNKARISQVFTNIAADTVTGVYHLTNTGGMMIDDDTWTVSDASIDFFSPVVFPSLNTNAPMYGMLYSDVQIGNPTATGASNNFKEGAETLSAVYAYLHPQSPHRYDSDYLARLKVLLAARFGAWDTATGNALSDIAGSFQAAYAYMLLKHYRPADLSASEIAAWELSLDRFCNHNLGNSLLYDDHILAHLWLNGDIRIAKAIYFSGIATANAAWMCKAYSVINEVIPDAVVGDGATHYVGFNNEVATYRDVTIGSMLWWWIITGSEEMILALDKTVPYIPLSVEPGGFQEQSSAISYKHMYNGLQGHYASLATAYLHGDGYNYYFGQDVEDYYSADFGIILAALYTEPLTPTIPPTDFIIHDRAIMGPRGRWADWAFVATGRDPQTPGPDHSSQGYEGRMGGKNTFVGAMALGSWTNSTALRAALDGVCPEFKNKTGVTTDWARSHSDGGVYRFLSQDENTSTITRDTFATLATDYRLSERTSSSATTNWGTGTAWFGEQLWLLTEDRLVGLVQVHNETADTVYGLDTRMVLTGGRTNIIGQYLDLVQVAPNEYDFGELNLRIGENNFGGTQTVQRVGMQNGIGDEYGAILRLHDSANPVDDTQINYPSGTRRWAVLEFIRNGRSLSTLLDNVDENDNNVAVLDVRESGRRFRLIQNLTDSTKTYTGNFTGEKGAVATQHKSWTNTVDTLSSGQGKPKIPINIDLPAYGHAVVVSGTNPLDHTGNVSFYEDVFVD